MVWTDTRNPNLTYQKIIRKWHDAEMLAAAWMRRLGYPDAEASPPGPDNGIDVQSVGAVAQVKCWAPGKRAGIRDVQRIAGSAEPGQACAFFSTSGYTRKAYGWACASDREVALFRLRHDGTILAVNRCADLMLCQAPVRLAVNELPPINRLAEVIWALLAVTSMVLCTLSAAWTLSTRGADGIPPAIVMLLVSCVLLLPLHFQFRGLGRAMLALRRAGRARSLTPLVAALDARRSYRDAGTPPDLFVGVHRSQAIRAFDALEDAVRLLRQNRRRWQARRKRDHRAVADSA